VAKINEPADASTAVAAVEESVLDSVDCPELPEEPATREASSAALSVLAAVPVCGTARIHAIDGDRVRLAFGSEVVDASKDPSVHPAVLAGALERKERVLAEHRPAEGWVVVGALHTQPVPGIDRADEYTVEADRVHIKADSEVALSARTASLVVRAIGEVETYAERILSRAEGIHRIVGRLLHLN
jgi:hypothetical protein